jgi:hypothetical protein
MGWDTFLSIFWLWELIEFSRMRLNLFHFLMMILEENFWVWWNFQPKNTFTCVTCNVREMVFDKYSSPNSVMNDHHYSSHPRCQVEHLYLMYSLQLARRWYSRLNLLCQLDINIRIINSNPPISKFPTSPKIRSTVPGSIGEVEYQIAAITVQFLASSCNICDPYNL